jgi:hypothetical protein
MIKGYIPHWATCSARDKLKRKPKAKNERELFNGNKK